MALKLSTATRQAMALAIVAQANAGGGDAKIRFYNDALGLFVPPEIAYIVFPNPIESDVTDGVITLNEQTDYVWETTLTEALAVRFALINSLDEIVLEGLIGGPGTSYELSTVEPNLTASRGIELVTRTITIGNPT